jgi:hypothetical protein
MYAKGSGCRQDNLEAYRWLFIAAGNGEPDSELLKELRENMTPAQIHEAETKASTALFRKSEAQSDPTTAIRIPPAPVRPAPPTSSAYAASGFFITTSRLVITSSPVRLGFASRLVRAKSLHTWSGRTLTTMSLWSKRKGGSQPFPSSRAAPRAWANPSSRSGSRTRMCRDCHPSSRAERSVPWPACETTDFLQTMSRGQSIIIEYGTTPGTRTRGQHYRPAIRE